MLFSLLIFEISISDIRRLASLPILPDLFLLADIINIRIEKFERLLKSMQCNWKQKQQRQNVSNGYLIIFCVSPNFQLSDKLINNFKKEGKQQCSIIQIQIGMERYDRSSVVGLTMTTVNPCNNFIIDYLIRNKIKADKQVSNKYYMYNLAIQSVRKYPLPLICEEQLAALEGFGNFFINRVGKLMKRHYLRGRMPTPEEMLEDDRDHLEGIRENLRRIKQGKRQKEEEQEKSVNESSQKKGSRGRKNQQRSSQDQNQNLNESELIKTIKEQEQEQGENNKKIYQDAEKFERLMMQNNQEQKIERKSRRSSAPSQDTSRRGKAKRQIYRPRKGTQPFEILKAILELEKRGKKPVIKGDINEYMFNKRKEKMKGWTPVRDRLAQFGYVTQSRFNQDEVTLTEKGKDYIYQVQNKQSQNQNSRGSSSQSSSKSQPKKKTSRSEKQNQSSKSRRPHSTAPGQSSTYNKTSYTQSKRRKIKHRENSKHFIRYGLEPKIKKEQLTTIKAKEPTILYNDRSELNQKDEDRIIELFNQNKEIKYREESLEIADFVWQVGSSILDMMVFRIKCQTFDLDEFFLQCQLAKKTQCENVYFVFEESISLSKTKIMDTKSNLLKTVFADGRVAGFKIIKTTGLGQTISFVSKLHSEILKKIKALNPFSTSKLFYLGTLKQIKENIRQFKPAILRNVAVNCLKCLPNMSKQMIKKIIRKMPSLSFIFQKLKALRSNTQRKKFLLWYLQELKPKKGTIRLIVDLMFFQDYDDN